MPTLQTTTIPKVPIRTPFFDEQGNIDRTWVYFFERVAKGNGNPAAGGGPGGSGGPPWATLDLKDTTVGNGIADVVPVHSSTPGDPSTAQRVIGVLKTAITSDLTLRINVVVSGSPSVVGTFTIPHTTAVNTAVVFTSFTTSALPDLSVLTWDVTASDGAAVSEGVATFVLIWE